MQNFREHLRLLLLSVTIHLIGRLPFMRVQLNTFSLLLKPKELWNLLNLELLKKQKSLVQESFSMRFQQKEYVITM